MEHRYAVYITEREHDLLQRALMGYAGVVGLIQSPEAEEVRELGREIASQIEEGEG